MRRRPAAGFLEDERLAGRLVGPATEEHHVAGAVERVAGLEIVDRDERADLVSYGASVRVVCPGAGSPHDHDTKPEQSLRYLSHSALLAAPPREQVPPQMTSLPPLGPPQYGMSASTHWRARASVRSANVAS